jgi:uncharacterized protein YkwD
MRRFPRIFLIFLFAVLLGESVQPGTRVLAGSGDGPMVGQASSSPASRSAQKATLKPAAATAPNIGFDAADASAEQTLLTLANESRQQAGAPPLTLDPGLAQAARIHAKLMVDAQQLSHQFDGEPSLLQRLAATTTLQLDQEGENVAFDNDAEHGHEHLMLSPPHRANLLNPAFNVVGLGVLRSGERLYIVEDFGHALPSYSVDEVKNRIAAVVSQARQQAHQPELQRLDVQRGNVQRADLHSLDPHSGDAQSPNRPAVNPAELKQQSNQVAIDEAACSMAQADKLGTPAVRKLAEHSTVISYTSLDPETLPNGADRAIAGPNLRNFSIGVCYARTTTYPTGVYWVVLSLN